MRLPVLTYHAVLPVDRSARIRGTVSLPAFKDQVAWLRRRGYTTLTLDQAADLLEGRTPPVPRPVVLSFDDGYRCVLDHALPVLEEAGFRAILFVVTGAVGETTDWYVRKGGPRLEHADWSELARARERGFEVGAHGVSHRPLSTADPRELREEVWESKGEIAKRLGDCRHFAYPFGAFSAEAGEAVCRAGYRTGSTTRRGFNRAGQRLEALRRQNVSWSTGAARFRRRVGSLW